jgi:hypothetical protein
MIGQVLGRILAADFGFDIGEALTPRLIFVAGRLIPGIAERLLNECRRLTQFGIAINISLADPAGERIDGLTQVLLLPAWVCCDRPSHIQLA